MGTPMRSKSFHDAYYGNMGDNGLPDQIEMIKQLGHRYPSMNLDKVGIWGHSGGGFAAADAILRYPDLYKVAVSQAGNHDNRTYEDDWGERYHGLLSRNADGTTNYDSQANQLLAKNLKGKLLIAHGTMDNNVPPNNTMALADALIKADKDFELIMMPNRRHGFGNEPYVAGVPHINHPNFRWSYGLTELLQVRNDPLLEIHSGHPQVNNEGATDPPAWRRSGTGSYKSGNGPTASRSTTPTISRESSPGTARIPAAAGS